MSRNLSVARKWLWKGLNTTQYLWYQKWPPVSHRHTISADQLRGQTTENRSPLNMRTILRRLDWWLFRWHYQTNSMDIDFWYHWWAHLAFSALYKRQTGAGYWLSWVEDPLCIGRARSIICAKCWQCLWRSRWGFANRVYVDCQTLSSDCFTKSSVTHAEKHVVGKHQLGETIQSDLSSGCWVLHENGQIYIWPKLLICSNQSGMNRLSEKVQVHKKPVNWQLAKWSLGNQTILPSQDYRSGIKGVIHWTSI